MRSRAPKADTMSNATATGPPVEMEPFRGVVVVTVAYFAVYYGMMMLQARGSLWWGRGIGARYLIL